MKCLSIESRIIICSSVSVDSLLLALSRIRSCESLFALLFVMESRYGAGLCFYRVAVVSLFKFTLSALPLPRQSPGSSLLKRGCCGDTPCCVGTRLKSLIVNFKRVPTQHGVSPQHPRFNRVAAASVTVSLMRAVHGKRDGKANRPFFSRVMKERRV